MAKLTMACRTVYPTHAHARAHTHAHTHTVTHTRTRAHAHTGTHTHTRAHTHARTHTVTHTHTHTHTHKHTWSGNVYFDSQYVVSRNMASAPLNASRWALALKPSSHRMSPQ